MRQHFAQPSKYAFVRRSATVPPTTRRRLYTLFLSWPSRPENSGGFSMRFVSTLLVFVLAACLGGIAQEQQPQGQQPPVQPKTTDAAAPAPAPATAPAAADAVPATSAPPVAAPATSATTSAVSSQAVASGSVPERIFAQEAQLVERMHHYTPLVETYIQNMKPDPDLVQVPGSDKYFLGRLALGPLGIKGQAFKDNNKSSFMYQVVDRLNSFYKLTYHHG